MILCYHLVSCCLLTPSSRAFTEKLTVHKLVNNFVDISPREHETTTMHRKVWNILLSDVVPYPSRTDTSSNHIETTNFLPHQFKSLAREHTYSVSTVHTPSPITLMQCNACSFLSPGNWNRIAHIPHDVWMYVCLFSVFLQLKVLRRTCFVFKESRKTSIN
jgi:hypothetical protein